MTRFDIVKSIMNGVKRSDVVIASTGLIGREVFWLKDRDLNFYMMGSMGNALAIGIGIAMYYPGDVHVINGDGSALMGLGTMATVNSLSLDNLHHIVLDNNCHESTGGQPTSSSYVLFEDIGWDKVIIYEIERGGNIPPRIPLTPAQITKRFKHALHNEQEKQKAIR